MDTAQIDRLISRFEAEMLKRPMTKAERTIARAGLYFRGPEALVSLALEIGLKECAKDRGEEQLELFK